MTTTLAPVKPALQRMRERIFIRCKQIRVPGAPNGLSRYDRLEIASYVLGREITSFDQLSPQELSRLIDGFEAAYYIVGMLGERQRGERF